MIQELLAQSNRRVSSISVPTIPVRPVSRVDFAAAVESNREGMILSLTSILDSIEGVSSTRDNADSPRYPSHQPAAEVNSMFSRDTTSNQSIASTGTMIETVIAPKLEQLTSLKDLSQNPDSLATPEVLDQLRSSSMKGATVAGALAQASDISNGSYIINSGNSVVVNGNSVSVNSDTQVGMTGPLLSLNSQDTYIQSNNSYVCASCIKIDEVGTSILTASGGDIRQSATTLDVTSGSHDTLSATNRVVGTASAQFMGGEVGIAANNNTSILSGDSYTNVSFKSHLDRALDITMMAVDLAGVDSSNPSAATEADGEGLPVASGGNISISSLTASGQSSLTMASQGLAQFTTGDYVSSSVGTSTLSSLTSAAVVGTIRASLMNSTASLNIVGPFARLGRGKLGISEIKVPLLQQLPPLPSLPTIPTDLSNCIPSKYKQQSQGGSFAEAAQNALNNGTSVRLEGISPSNPISSTGTSTDRSTARSSANPSSARTSSQNPTRIAQDLSNNVGIGGNAKLPAPTASQPESNSNVVTNSAIGTGLQAPLDIFLSPPREKDSNPLLDYLITEGIVEEEDGDGDEVSSLVRLSNFTTSAFQQELSFLPSSDRALFNNPAVLDAIGLTPNIRTSTFAFLPQAERDHLIRIIRSYPQAAGALESLRSRYLSTIGLLAVGFLPKGILGKVNVAFNFAKVISNRDISGVFNIGRNLLSSALPGSPIANILNNPSFGSIGNAILGGGNIQNVIIQEVKRNVLSRVESIIPSNYVSAAGNIRDLIVDLQRGEPVNESDMVSRISRILAEVTGVNEFNNATNIYGNLRTVIQAASSGDYLSLLGGSVTNLISPILGTENATKMQGVLNTILVGVDVGKTFAKIPELLSLMGDYKIPAIDQISTMLSCLDLVNKIKGLISSIEGLQDMFKRSSPSSSETPYSSINPYSSFSDPAGIGLPVYILESLPRLIQVHNTARDITRSPIIDRVNSRGEFLSFTEDPELNSLIAEITGIDLDLGLSDCFKLPSLNLSNSEVTILKVEQNRILFSTPNYSSEEGQYIPSEGDFINYKVSYFLSRDGSKLYPYQSDNQYTPSVYRYVVTSFNPVNNIGVALITINSNIVLVTPSGTLREFSTQSIGLTLTPIIIDSYLAE